MKLLLQRRADAPDERDRLVGKEAPGFGPADDREAARLVQIGGDLGQRLVVGEPDRGGDPDLGLDAPDQPDERARRARPVQPLGAREIEEGLVDRERLDQRRGLQHQRPNLAADAGVFCHVGADHHRVGAGLEGLEHRHRRTHAIGPRDVAGGRDHAPFRPSDDHRLFGQGRVVALLHRGVEGVAVDMGNGKRVELGMRHDPSAAAGRAALRRRLGKDLCAIPAQSTHFGALIPPRPPSTARRRPARRWHRHGWRP